MVRDKKRTIVLLWVILIAWLPLFMAAWDKGQPVEGGLAPDLNDVIRANNDALEAALNAWAYFETGGVQTGRPRPGSARPYFQDAVPTTRLDGDYFTSDDYGTIWIDSNATIDNQFNILTAADGAGTETWTPISTEVIAVLLAANRIFAGTLKSTGDFTVGANKVVVTAATGNTAIAGVATLGDTSALATSGAPAADAQIANKKYVDDQLAAAVPDDDAFGAWASKSTDTVYEAETDGFVSAISTSNDKWIYGYTDSSNPPTTERCRHTTFPDQHNSCWIFMPVKKGDFWKVTDCTTIYWLPIGG